MKKLIGSYFDGKYPLANSATLEIHEDSIHLVTSQIDTTFDRKHVTVSPQVGSASRFLSLPNGSQFCCKQHPILDDFQHESPTEGPVAWVESRWKFALASVVFTIGALSFGYIWGLPQAARVLANRIPLETETTLGEKSLAWLDKNWFDSSPHVFIKNEDEIVSGFERLCKSLTLKGKYRLEFRAFNNSRMHPNAFALPGGIIVLTTSLAEFANTSEEIIAILAHEIGHLELRHNLRQLLQNSGTALIGAMISPDAASFNTAVKSYPLLLAASKYSRDLEEEADEFAFVLLRKINHSPAAFATITERLEKNFEMDEYGPSFVSTHPLTKERIKRARNFQEKP